MARAPRELEEGKEYGVGTFWELPPSQPGSPEFILGECLQPLRHRKNLRDYRGQRWGKWGPEKRRDSPPLSPSSLTAPRHPYIPDPGRWASLSHFSMN